MDFPQGVTTATPLFISTHDKYGVGQDLREIQTSNWPVSTTWTANLAIYCPLSIPFNYTVRRMWWINGSVVGSNVDVGVYSATGVKLYSQGSATQGITANALFYASLATPLALSPGLYYIAFSCDGTTNRVQALATTAACGRQVGLLQQASAATLPATATFAAYGGAGLPYYGITRTASGF